MSKSIAFAGIAVVAAASAWYFWPQPQEEPKPEPVAEKQEPEQPQQKPKVLSTDVVSIKKEGDDLPEEERVSLPDGSHVPSLNGVKGLARLGWPSDVPWSPIIRKTFHAGLEWYVHEDGSRSTTINAKQPNGSILPMGYVANPAEVAPSMEHIPQVPQLRPGAGDRK